VPAASPGAERAVGRDDGPPLVGRDDVMSRLVAALHDARSGKGRLVLLTGEAGIGKTRCAQELGAIAQRSGASVWIGRCVGEGAPAFWPWIQVLRASCADHRIGVAGRRASEAMISRLAPQGLPPAEGPRASALTPSDPSRFWLSDALVRCLRQSAEPRPRVVILDDLQAADEGSIEALGLLAPELAETKMLVIGTLRDEPDTGRDVGVLRVRPLDIVPLSPLTFGDTERFLADALGQESTPELTRALYSKTEGNPLLVQETVRLVRERRGRGELLRVEDVRLPEVARQVIRDRIATLDPSVRELLSAAAVFGAEFELPMLKRVTSLSSERLLAGLEAALRARYIESHAAESQTYTFSHALIRDALYEALPAGERKRLHARAAAALETLALVRPKLGAIAYHLHCALPEADAVEVCRFARLAGDSAMELFSYDEAAQFYAWAVESSGYAERPPDPRTTCELLLSSALAARRAGRVREARDHCRRAIAIARREGFSDLLVDAARCVRPTVWLAQVPDPLALDALEQARPPLSMATQVRASALLACIPPYSLAVEKSAALSEEAVRIARELGDRSLLLEALSSSFHSLSGPDRVAALLAVADEVLALDGPVVSWWSAEAFFARFQALSQIGDMPGADRALAAFGECAHRLRMPEATWNRDRIRAQELLYSGDFALAEARFHDLFAQSQSFRTNGIFQYAAQMNALSWERDGKALAGAALANADVAWKWAAALPVYRAERILSLIDLGETTAARSEFDDVAKDDFRAVSRDLSYVYTLSRLAMGAAKLGQRQPAQVLYGLLRPYAKYNAINGFSISLGSASHFLGVLAAMLGDLAAAEKHFEDSVAMNLRIGHPVHARSSEAALGGLVPTTESAYTFG
jgi:hypothetical protein